MIIWIVEDDKSAADDAAKEVLAVAKANQEEFDQPLAVYWDASIEWEPALERLYGPTIRQPAELNLEHPEIVILDIFDGNGEFKAESFLRALRRWEVSQSPPLPASRVILWSVKSGLTGVDRFLREESDRDRNVISLKTRGPTALREAIVGCWKSWQEERYP